MGAEVVERTHSLNPDRIRITGNHDRTVIAREYPDETALERLAEVAWQAIVSTDLKDEELQAYGYNIELVYEPSSQDLAIEYLSKRLFTPHLLQDGGWQLMGGSGRLYFQKHEQLWQANLEPRFNNPETTKIFASLNLHQSEAVLAFPSESDIRDRLNLLWSEAHKMVEQLDGSNS